jgi:methylated-DNA-[protein]-cysteine S-methyltransferase
VEMIEYAIRESSLGTLLLMARNGKLIELDIAKDAPYDMKKKVIARHGEAIESDKPFRTIFLLLDRYLKGENMEFDVGVDISEEGEFTRRVLDELRKIPYGEVRSYGWIAKQLGYERAGRAVGQAVGRNPIPIVIPCHRIIRSDGSIGGFGLGVGIKERLLAIEGVKLKKQS